MERKDLTLKENFASKIGSFWTTIFDDGRFANGLGENAALQLSQVYKDISSFINCASASTMPIFRRECVFPIAILKSDIEDNSSIPMYGDGHIYGNHNIGEGIIFGEKKQSKDLYFVNINSEVNLAKSSAPSIILSRLNGGAILWVKDIDFFIHDNRIVLKFNPFDIEDFEKRLIRNNGQDDIETTLWLCEVDIEHNDIFRHFGSLFSKEKESSNTYKEYCKQFLSLISLGPSISRIGSFFAAATGSPIIQNDTEVITEVHKSVDGVFVETDKSLIKIPDNQTTKETSTEGSELKKGDSLTSVVDVIDTSKNKSWWKSFEVIPIANIFADKKIQYLVFPNKKSEITFFESGPKGLQQSKTLFRFNLIGDIISISAFWEGIDSFILSSDKNFASDMEYDTYKATGEQFVHFINPAKFFADYIANKLFIPIRIDISQVVDVQLFFSLVAGSIFGVQRVLPIYAFCPIFIDTKIEDVYEISNGFVTEIIPSLDSYRRAPKMTIDELHMTGEKPIVTELILVQYRSKCTL